MIQKPEKRFAISFLAATALLLGGIIALCIWVDPRALFGTNKFVPLVSTARPTKLALLTLFTQKPDVLILGGSNTYKMDPKQVKSTMGLVAFNLGVDNAKTEDFLAFTKYAIENLGIKPRLIILGIHPESFNSNRIHPQIIQISKLRSKLVITPAQYVTNLFSILGENLTLQYLGDVMRVLYYSLHGYPPLEARFRPDGYGLHETDTHTIEEHFVSDRETIINNFVRDYSGTKLSEDRKKYFEEFLDFTKQHAIELRIVLLPFHPKILSLLKETPEFKKIYEDMGTFIAKEKEKYQFNYYDFIDVSSFAGDPNDFSDLVHAGPTNSSKMIKIILSDHLIKSR